MKINEILTQDSWYLLNDVIRFLSQPEELDHTALARRLAKLKTKALLDLVTHQIGTSLWVGRDGVVGLCFTGQFSYQQASELLQHVAGTSDQTQPSGKVMDQIALAIQSLSLTQLKQTEMQLKQTEILEQIVSNKPAITQGQEPQTIRARTLVDRVMSGPIARPQHVNRDWIKQITSDGDRA